MPLQCERPRSNAGCGPPIRLGARIGPVVIRKRPRSIPHSIESAALEGILDLADRVGIVGAEELLPRRRQEAFPGGRWEHIGGKESCENDGDYSLNRLQRNREELSRYSRVCGCPEVKVGGGVKRGEDGEDDGEDGDGGRHWQR